MLVVHTKETPGRRNQCPKGERPAVCVARVSLTENKRRREEKQKQKAHTPHTSHKERTGVRQMVINKRTKGGLIRWGGGAGWRDRLVEKIVNAGIQVKRATNGGQGGGAPLVTDS